MAVPLYGLAPKIATKCEGPRARHQAGTWMPRPALIGDNSPLHVSDWVFLFDSISMLGGTEEDQGLFAS